MSTSGSVFSETLQTITTTKLEELAKQRNTFEQGYAALLAALKAEKDPLKRVLLLTDGTKLCLGVRTSGKNKDGRPGRVISSEVRNQPLETDLQHIDRFLEQARFDPSVSIAVLEDWEKTLLQHLSVQSVKFQYADLYGKLVTEWLSSEKTAPDDGDVEMTESFEELPGAKKLAARAAWEKSVFEPSHVNVKSLEAYLDQLFIKDNKDGAAAIKNLRQKVETFENDLSRPSQFTVYNLRTTIQGLENSDLLSNEKREALKDFLSNDVILAEIADILNLRMTALDRWTWGDYVSLEQRRKLNGTFSIHFDPDLLQAIFLHYIGIRFSVFFKAAFLAIHDHSAWKGSHVEVPRVDRMRRSYFLGDQGISTKSILQKKRIKTQRNKYFAHQLLDFETQQIEVEEGEEEAEYDEYVAAPKKRKASMHRAVQAPRKQLASQATRRAAPPQPMFSQDGVRSRDRVNYSDEDDDDDEDEDEDDNYLSQSKRPMEVKQGLLHLLSTEIIVNTRLHGELTCFRTVFESWNPLLPHESILTVLGFFGVSNKWKTFIQRFLQAPLKFTDDASSEPRLRRRGTPGSHSLSDILGEAVLFCMDFAINQATEGALMYRLYDDIWFWNKDYEKCVEGWASLSKFAEVAGVKLNENKTGSVRISSSKRLIVDGRLPDGEIRWGFLLLDPTTGRFEIDERMVDGHIEELRSQLQGKSKSVIDYIQAWNSYATTFISSNFGKASNCFGQEHVDKMLATHRRIQESIFPGSNVVQHLKKMIEDRFSVSGLPDGFLFFPVDLGGLELKSPFVGLLQIRESVQGDPYDLLNEFEEKERDDYLAAKRRFDKDDVKRRLYNRGEMKLEPKEAETFFDFAEFTRYREAFATVGQADLRSVYVKLLQEPDEEPIDVSAPVNQALNRLQGQTNLRGISAYWANMGPYWKWIAQMYGPEMIDRFGGLNVVDFGLLPIGMVSMFRQRRTKWQG